MDQLRRFSLAIVCSLSVVSALGAETQPAASDADHHADLVRVRSDLIAGKPGNIVCLGDSVTGVYYHTGSRRAYTDMLGLALRKTLPNANVKMINAGISGNTTANGLERLGRDVLKHRPDLVTVMFGLNDMTRVPLESFKSNLRTIIEKCRAAGAAVLLATPNNVIDTPSRPTAKLLEYCAAMKAVGNEQAVSVCDIYQHMENLRLSNQRDWRLLMSDEIHPNMDGHRVIAEQLAQSITGLPVSLADVHAPKFSIERMRQMAASGKKLRVLAMPPVDESIEKLLSELIPGAKCEVTQWPTAGFTLDQIEKDAKTRVRALKPDLVMIAVPQSSIESATHDEFVHGFAWVMNWSLNFGQPTWDVIVVHPAVFRSASVQGQRDQLIRQLVRAQDLPLLDRAFNNQETHVQLMRDWFLSP